MSEAAKAICGQGDKVVITSVNNVSHMNCVVLAIDDHGIAVEQLGKTAFFGWNMIGHIEKQTKDWQSSKI